MKKTSIHLLELLIIFSLMATTTLSARADEPAGTALSESSGQLKILSWNIGMLPFLGIFKSRNERASAIAEALFVQDYDIVVFQEAFTAEARATLKHRLQELYPFAYGPINGSKLSWKFNSGIWILSKIPLKILKEMEFRAGAGMDCFARKGAVLLEGQSYNTTFQLIATHLQDDDYPQEIRDRQLSEIYDNLIAPYSDPSKPQIICGDLNTDEQKEQFYKGMLSLLNAEDGEISGPTRITFDDVANDAFKSSNQNPRIIDYILTRNPQFIKQIDRKVAVLKSKWGNNKEYLSDHHGLEAVIVFSNLDYLSSLRLPF